MTILCRILLIALLAVPLAACQKKPPPRQPAVTGMAAEELRQAAERAWEAGDYHQSELYYEDLLDKADLSRAQRLVALRRYAVSALRADHAQGALRGLERWAEARPEARSEPGWNTFKTKALTRADEPEKLRLHLEGVMDEMALSQSYRLRAGERLLEVYHRLADDAGAARLLTRMWGMAPDRETRLWLEKRAFDWLSGLSLERLEELAALAARPERAGLFASPHIRFMAAAAKAEDDRAAWPASWNIMRSVLDSWEFADPSPWLEIYAELEEEYGIPKTGVALLLPLSGRFSKVGWSVLRGAGLAEWMRSREGALVEVAAINTAAEGWTERLADLPSHYTVVGGPIRVDAFSELEKSGQLEQRAVFAFLPGLGRLEEGRDAWRFFSSMDDQARSLVSLAVDDLGIERFAVVYPDEKYGLRASQVFWEAVDARNATITGLSSYPPEDPSSWGESVADLLRVKPKDPETGERPPSPEPDFKAVFLPDGWSQAQLLVPHFFFYGEDRLLFLGPELWSQALVDGGDVEERYFRLSATPSAWWPEAGGGAAHRLRREAEAAGIQPDFWTALGFDFARLASALGSLASPIDPDEVNEQLAEVEALGFALAPFDWDAQGRVSQEMHLFRPVGGGLERVVPQELADRMERIRKRHEEFIKRREEKREAEKKEAAQSAQRKDTP
ncbi:penicillin-binding protein activator [Desulfohalovibrio reitneri]|uniref:penicillin-binding protein activator n=1 Tax=Desulfohalovibrio reitneri TaxID=1307759 RepID=UPI00054E8ACB|nr:ABC transporter substrate-binding protein [Desulfohalovibrio reitneri]